MARRVPIRGSVSAAVRVGTSGWQYRHWAGDFYPAELPTSEWLAYYVERFDTVELNASFYRLPRAEAFAAWGRRVPDGFRFAVKASRYLTHVKRLKDPDEPLDRFWTRVRRLGDRCGPVLYQLPPHWRPDWQRLDAFLAAIPRGPWQAIEIRDARWYGEELERRLEAAGVTLCLHDMEGSAWSGEPIGPFGYVRFHGAGAKYGGRYPDDILRGWADRLATWARRGQSVWVYFNNDIGGHAPRDATRLRGFVEELLT